jgi:hypothetical protein
VRAKRYLLVLLSAVALSSAAGADSDQQPVRLAWREGDVAGFSSILSPDSSKIIGIIEFHQHMRAGILKIQRVARFVDGSSDEDQVDVRIGTTIESVGGRLIIRDTKGRPTVDLKIDVAGGHITGFSGTGEERKDYDEKVELTPATYWGPLIFILLKNFEQNAVDGKLAFQTVVATPKPRIIGMELLAQDQTALRLHGLEIPATKFILRPAIHPLIDPIVRLFAPDTFFFIQLGAPPALVRFEGPRNYAGQKIRIE